MVKPEIKMIPGIPLSPLLSPFHYFGKGRGSSHSHFSKPYLHTRFTAAPTSSVGLQPPGPILAASSVSGSSPSFPAVALRLRQPPSVADQPSVSRQPPSVAGSLDRDIPKSSVLFLLSFWSEKEAVVGDLSEEADRGMVRSGTRRMRESTS